MDRKSSKKCEKDPRCEHAHRGNLKDVVSRVGHIAPLETRGTCSSMERWTKEETVESEGKSVVIRVEVSRGHCCTVPGNTLDVAKSTSESDGDRSDVEKSDSPNAVETKKLCGGGTETKPPDCPKVSEKTE